MNLNALRPQLEGVFAQRPVRLAYLFGSRAKGRTHAESDVDVAVLLDESLTENERFAERLMLIGELSCLFRTDNVDVAILNEASPLLCYNVLRDGVLLHCADENTRIAFQVRTFRTYEDTAPLRRILTEAMEKRIRAGTFGKPALAPKRDKTP